MILKNFSALTQQFYKKLMKFLYPEKDPNALDEEDVQSSANESRSSKGNKHRKGGKNGKSGAGGGRNSKANTSFYVDIQTEDDVEKMKRRAEENKMFVYVKMTELPVRLSYKGLNKVHCSPLGLHSSLILACKKQFNEKSNWINKRNKLRYYHK